MATVKKKLIQQDIERDEVAEKIVEIREYLAANRLRFGIIAGAVVLVIILYVGYSSHRQTVLTESSQVLTSANLLFGELSGMKDESERTKRLEATIGGLQDLIDRYPDSPSARSALMLKGSCYYYMDNLPSAVDTFQKFLAKATDAEDKARGEIALGYAVENQFYFDDSKKEKLDEAIKHFQTAAQTAPPKSYLYYSGLLSMARILELTSRDADAIKIYKQVMAERTSPRGTEEKLKMTDANAKMGLMQAIEYQVMSRMEPLSFFSTAKFRVDQLEATAKIIQPNQRPAGPRPAPPAAPPTTTTTPNATPAGRP